MVTPQNTARFWSHVDRGPGCWEWQAARTRRGYGQGWIGKRGLAHRLAWEVTYGPIPPGLSVLHRCDHPPCVRPDHLFLGTQRDNMQDAVRKARVPSGERRASAKLTRAQVHRLRAEYVGQPLRQLAAQYGIAPSTVYAILRGAKWRRDTRGVDIFRQQPTRRLSPALVREIRTRHAAGERARDLARAYGVHESSLSLLVRRLSYRAA